RRRARRRRAPSGRRAVGLGGPGLALALALRPVALARERPEQVRARTRPVGTDGGLELVVDALEIAEHAVAHGLELGDLRLDRGAPALALLDRGTRLRRGGGELLVDLSRGVLAQLLGLLLRRPAQVLRLVFRGHEYVGGGAPDHLELALDGERTDLLGGARLQPVRQLEHEVVHLALVVAVAGSRE